MRFAFSIRTSLMALALALAAPGCQSTKAPAGPAAPAESSDPEADRAGVAATLESMHAAWNAHDMQAFGALFVEDASFINIFGHRLLTRATITEHHQKLHEGHFRESKLLPISSSIRLLGQGLAVAVLNWELEGARDPRTDQPVETTSGFMTTTLRKDAEGWRIIALQNTRMLPLPDGAGAPAGKPASEPAGTPAGKPAGTPAGMPAGKPAGTPAGKPAGTPAGKPADTPAGKPAGTPVAKPAGAPAAKPAGAPAAKPAGAPAAKPAAKPAVKPAGALP